jgi:hypothetical protein
VGDRKGGGGGRDRRGPGGAAAVESGIAPEPPPPIAVPPPAAPASVDSLVAARAEWADIRQVVLRDGDHVQAIRRARELVAGLTRAQAVALAGLLPSATKKAALQQVLDTIDADYFTHAKLIEVDRAARKAGKDFGGM